MENETENPAPVDGLDKQLIIKLTTPLHTAFKTKCSGEQSTMQDKVFGWVSLYVKPQEEQVIVQKPKPVIEQPYYHEKFPITLEKEDADFFRAFPEQLTPCLLKFKKIIQEQKDIMQGELDKDRVVVKKWVGEGYKEWLDSKPKHQYIIFNNTTTRLFLDELMLPKYGFNTRDPKDIEQKRIVKNITKQFLTDVCMVISLLETHEVEKATNISLIGKLELDII